MSNRDHALIHASGIGDKDLVIKLIERGASATFYNGKYYSWEKALLKNRLEIAEYILNYISINNYILSREFTRIMIILINNYNIDGIKLVLKYCKTINDKWID